jgi:hypothetical protein
MLKIEQGAAYLAAMIDGEGWIGEPKPDTFFNRAVRIANTDPDLIQAISEACDWLGITYTVQVSRPQTERRAKLWVVDITGRENMVTIRQQVPIQAARKRERLDRQIASYRRPEPLNPHELRRLYHDEHLTIPAVAARLGVDKKRVLLAMRAYGIPRRVRDSAMDATVWRTRRERYGRVGRR